MPDDDIELETDTDGVDEVRATDALDLAELPEGPEDDDRGEDDAADPDTVDPGRAAPDDTYRGH